MVLIVIGALLLIIAALAAWLGLSTLKVKNEVEAAIQAASRIQSQVQAGDTDKAQASIEAFSQHIDATYAQTKQPVWKLATLVPYYGSDVKAARDMVHILEDVSNNALPKLAKAAQALDFNSIGIKDGTIQLGGYGQRGTGSCRRQWSSGGCQRRHGQDWRYAYSADYRGGAAGA
ncbi:late cornified envelope protein 3C [Bifidobacterium longum subsp. longum]|nr:late cornified envelope protein 3C [Bifidobacterium longum subsp. longum]